MLLRCLSRGRCTVGSGVRAIKPWTSSSSSSFASSSSSVTVVETPHAPAAIGPYSQAIKANGFVFTSGSLGLDLKSGDFVSSRVEEQTRQALKNMSAVLEASGSSLQNVVKTTVMMASMDDYAAINAVYSQYFDGAAPPARSAFACKTLPKHALVEIECVATVYNE